LHGVKRFFGRDIDHGMETDEETGLFREIYRPGQSRKYPCGCRRRMLHGFLDHGANCLKWKGFLKLPFDGKAVLAIGFGRDFC